MYGTQYCRSVALNGREPVGPLTISMKFINRGRPRQPVIRQQAQRPERQQAPSTAYTLGREVLTILEPESAGLRQAWRQREPRGPGVR